VYVVSLHPTASEWPSGVWKSACKLKLGSWTLSRGPESYNVAKMRKSQFLLALRFSQVLVAGFLCGALAPSLLAQAAAEAAGTTAVSSSVTAGAKPMNMPKIPNAGTPAPPANSPGTASPHIVASSNANAQAVESNRRALESKAGADAARLLVRSYPSQAQVWIDDKPVGTTPLLLIVPAGKYKIELRGTREEIAKQEVALLPKETREVAVKLQLRYPTRVTSR
jgi:hypothetical protein